MVADELPEKVAEMFNLWLSEHDGIEIVTEEAVQEPQSDVMMNELPKKRLGPEPKKIGKK